MEPPRGQRGGESSAQGRGKQAVEALKKKNFIQLEMFSRNQQMKDKIKARAAALMRADVSHRDARDTKLEMNST